jgi:hypothetical protein
MRLEDRRKKSRYDCTHPVKYAYVGTQTILRTISLLWNWAAMRSNSDERAEPAARTRIGHQ